MTFLERFSQSPMAAFAACFVWIPVCVWIISAIGWMISGEVEVTVGALIIGAGIGLGVLVASPPDPRLGPLLFLGVLLTTVLFPFARVAMNRQALARIDIEQMDKYAEAVKLRPDNVGAMIKLAELLYKRGFPGQAIMLAEQALPHMPIAHFRAEHQMVGAWKLVTIEAKFFQPIPCLKCHKVNPVGQLYCVHCAYPTLVEMAKGRWLTGGSAMQFVSVWISALVILVGLPAAARLCQQALLAGVALIIVQLAVVVFVLIKAFLKRSTA